MIEITVKTLDSQNHPFSVEDDITVKAFKDLIAGKVHISAETQRLIYCGRVLHDDKKLNEYDVNGKVVHLVQRAPPQANRPSPNMGPQPRFQTRHHHVPPPNSIYLGSMAYSADMMDPQQGIPQLPLSQNLSNSRLNVARKMLRLASAIIRQLERNSTENTTTAADESMLMEDPIDIDTTPVLAAQVYVPAFPNVYGLEQQHHDMAAAAISAALSATNNFRHIVATPSQNNNGMPAENMPTDTVSSSPEVPSPVGETIEISNSTNMNPSPPSSATEPGINEETGRPAEATANTAPPQNGGNLARTTSLADLLDELNRIQTRLQPYMQRYNDLMRTDPTFETEVEATEAQRVFDRVSAAMHALGHAYHALSDVLCPFNRPAPRSLLCRPTLVQHAVLQAGISLPVRVQAHVDVENNTIRHPFTRSEAPAETPVDQSNETTVPPSENIPPETAANTEPTDERPAPQANNGRESRPQPPPTDNTQRPSAAAGRPFVGSARNVDIIVAMSPDDEGIPQGIAGPSQDLLQSLVHAVTNSVMRSVNLGSGPVSVSTNYSVQNPTSESVSSGNSSSSTSSASSTPSTDTSNATGGATLQGQNSQARGNTATLPTTSTQTPRSTPRPHVHLSPHSFRGFDPFLQCNSHHIGTIRSNRTVPPRQHVAREESPSETTSVQVRVRSTSLPRSLNQMRLAAREAAANRTSRSSTTAAAPQATQTGGHTCQASRAAQSSAQMTSSRPPTSAPVVPSTAHGMDVDTFYDATEHGVGTNESTETRPATRRVFLPTNGESSTPSIPEVNVGSETWHSNVPSEWVSVVTRDVQTQRQQQPQAPYSDAYLSSVPAKRRKVISCNKPQGSLPQVISDGLRQALLSTGLSQVAPIDLVVGAAAGDATLQAAYREELRESVRARPSHASAPELAPLKRFPNASIFFQKP